MQDGDAARFDFEVEGVDEELRVYEFKGEEHLSRPFRFEVLVFCEVGDLDFTQMIARPCQLTIWGERGPRFVNGMLASIAQEDSTSRFTPYRMQIVPSVDRLNYRYDCRIFQSQTVPEIVEAVFAAADFSADMYRIELSAEYAPREYCVQYRESDFAFVNRLLEEEGIHYFFEHSDGLHVLAIGDGIESFGEIDGDPTVPFHAKTGLTADTEHVFEFQYQQVLRSGAVSLRDYNFKRPSQNLQQDESSSQFEGLQVYDYPGRYDEPGLGATRSRVRLEELQSDRESASGRCNVPQLYAGARFDLADHPRGEFNRSYTATQVLHEGVQPQVLEEESTSGGTEYYVGFYCIPGDVVYRPPRLTRKPIMEGPQTAIVVGPAGEEIYTDEHGRIKVLFHWDRLSQPDENSSCWIRVSQVWAGASWGAIYTPRIGQEVVIDFLDGDPDRPIAVGRVYHGTNRTPYRLPAEKTKSTLKSSSTIGGGGFNEFRFEDKAGEEQVFLHAEKNQDLRIKNDRFEWVGHNRHLQVRTDKFEKVGNDRHEIVKNDHREEVGNDLNLKVGGKSAIDIGASHSLTVSGDVMEVFKANHSEKTTGNWFVKANGVVIESLSGITLKCGGSNIVIDPTGVTIKGSIVTIDGALVKIASGPGSQPMAGQAGSEVKPTRPVEALVADTAQPGKTSQEKAQKAAEQSAETPYQQDDEKEHWVEIELKDSSGNPLAGEAYVIKLPDGSTKKGSLDENGLARVEGIDPGSCEVTFPDLDQASWEKV